MSIGLPISGAISLAALAGIIYLKCYRGRPRTRRADPERAERAENGRSFRMNVIPSALRRQGTTATNATNITMPPPVYGGADAQGRNDENAHLY